MMRRFGIRGMRRGAACVEFAAVTPFLALTIVATVHVGQFVNVSNVVNNASREAARVAVRRSTTDTSQVRAAALSYISHMFGGISRDKLDEALKVIVCDTEGESVSGSELGSFTTGRPLCVKVEMRFEAVRWIRGFDSLSEATLHTTTVMRRE